MRQGLDSGFKHQYQDKRMPPAWTIIIGAQYLTSPWQFMYLHMFIHTTETTSCSGLMLSTTVCSFGGQTSMMDLGPYLLSIQERVLLSMVNYKL